MAKHSKLTTVTMGTSSGQILPAQEGRVGILFVPHLTATYTVAPDADTQANYGLNLLANAGAIQLSQELHGDIVKHAWYGVASGAGTTIGLLETFDV